jgi:hypothetical protein
VNLPETYLDGAIAPHPFVMVFGGARPSFATSQAEIETIADNFWQVERKCRQSLAELDTDFFNVSE